MKTQITRIEMIEWLTSLHKRFPIESIEGGFYRLSDAAMCQAVESFIAGSSSLAAERDDLLRWKAEAIQVMSDLNLQEIGKEIGLKLGGNIAANILPYIKELKGRLS